MSAKKSSRSTVDMMSKGVATGVVVAVPAASVSGMDISEKITRTGSSGNAGNIGGNGTIGLGSIAAPAVVSIDPNSADHVVAMTNLKERIASLEKRLQMKDKELLEKDKLLTELKSKNFDKEIEMRNKLKEVDRLHDMKVENLNRKVTSLLKEIAALKKNSKKNGSNSTTSGRDNRDREKRDYSPKEESYDDRDDKDTDRDEMEREDYKDGSLGSASNSPSTN